jgi:hypothetical protein
MMNATLEQAQLDKFVCGFITQPGSLNGRTGPRGEALITLTNMDAAVRCARHFHGRRWDASGIAVTAQLMPVKAPPKPRRMPSTRLQPSFTLSAEAPEFVPGALKTATVGKVTLPMIGSDVSTEDGESAASSDEKEVVN